MDKNPDHLQLLRSLNIRPFLQRSNGQATFMLLVNYSLILLAFALPIMLANPIGYLLSIVLLGNRQLGLGILMHDCAHHALFKSKAANQWVGRWLCAAPIFAQYEGYQHYHLRHHSKAGTDQDPDYPNYAPYPVKSVSVSRKILRDCFGVTGIKNFAFVLMMHAGVLNYDMAYKSTDRRNTISAKALFNNLVHNLYRPVLMHSVLIFCCWLAGNIGLYGLWWIAYFTTFSLFSRIRNAAEHAGVPDLLDLDPRRHARTVHASWLARLTVAPNHVNYHIEHHWLPQVPPYRLPELHQYLRKQGVLEGAEVLPNYIEVIRKMATPTVAGDA